MILIINLRHSDLFSSQTELKVIGHHHTYVRPKLKVIGHFVRRPCKRYFKAWLRVMMTGTPHSPTFNYIIIQQLGALTTKMRNGIINPYDGELTFLGRVLGDMPCDIRIGKLLVLGHVFGVLEEAIVIGSFRNTCNDSNFKVGGLY
jgi:hypothetical protein